MGRLLLISLLAAAASANTVIFSNLPAVLPVNTPSYGYEANGIDELGTRVVLGDGSRVLDSVTIYLSDWAHATDPDSVGVGDAYGYYHPVTLNLYATDASGTVGSLITFRTVDAYIPWSNRSGGVLVPVTFRFAGERVQVPDSLILTVAFNTEFHGADPIGKPGPYNSLNVATAATGGVAFPVTAGAYGDPDVGYVAERGGALTSSSGWAPYQPMFEIVGTPEPGTWLLLSAGLAAVAAVKKTKNRTSR